MLMAMAVDHRRSEEENIVGRAWAQEEEGRDTRRELSAEEEEEEGGEEKPVRQVRDPIYLTM